MSLKISRKSILNLVSMATKSARMHLRAERSKVVQDARQADRDFARNILAAAESAASVEDLIALEQNLQKSDLLKVKANEDRSSIIAAQRKYGQFAMTIAQMRNNPDSYIRLCMANIKNTTADPRRIITENSLAFINGNVTRMQSRAAFAPEGEREVWEARIAVAGKTADMFRELHESLAAAFERNTQPQKEIPHGPLRNNDRETGR